MLHVLLAEDHNIVRNGIKMLLETDPTINISGEATNGKEVLDHIENGTQIDIVLADINMPILDGISLLIEMKQRKSEIKTVILSMHDNEKYVAQAFSEGAVGYLLKSVSADELIFSLKHVHAGGRYICSELSFRTLERLGQKGYGEFSTQDKVDLSTREIEILHLIAEGFTNNEMSDQLFLSRRTIEGHRQSLIDKTGSRNTASLIRFAVLNGYVQ